MGNDFTVIIKSFVVIMLFSFLIIMFAVNLASEYQKDSTDYQNQLGLQGINKSLSQMNDQAEGWKTTFSSSSIFNPLSVAGIVVTTPFKIAIGMWNFITTPFDLLSNILIKVLKIPSIIINIAWVLIILTTLFGLWRYIKAGY